MSSLLPLLLVMVVTSSSAHPPQYCLVLLPPFAGLLSWLPRCCYLHASAVDQEVTTTGDVVAVLAAAAVQSVVDSVAVAQSPLPSVSVAVDPPPLLSTASAAESVALASAAESAEPAESAAVRTVQLLATVLADTVYTIHVASLPPGPHSPLERLLAGLNRSTPVPSFGYPR